MAANIKRPQALHDDRVPSLRNGAHGGGDQCAHLVQLSVVQRLADNRDALQAEVKQLTDEVDRVSRQTSFNGKKILDGSFTAATFQVGANAGDNITIGSLANTTADNLSTIAYGEVTVAAIDPEDAAFTGFGTAIADGTLDITVDGTVYELGALEAADSGTERIGQCPQRRQHVLLGA